jgi:hypothetical protein
MLTQQARVIRSYGGEAQGITSLLGIFHQQYYLPHWKVSILYRQYVFLLWIQITDLNEYDSHITHTSSTDASFYKLCCMSNILYYTFLFIVSEEEMCFHIQVYSLLIFILHIGGKMREREFPN